MARDTASATPQPPMDTLETPSEAQNGLNELNSYDRVARLSSSAEPPIGGASLPAEGAAPLGASPQAVRLWFEAAA